MSQPFPFTGDRATDDTIERLAALEDVADFPMMGALPLYYYGCTHSDILVVTGRNTGTVWYDGRGVDLGFLPYLRLPSGKMRLSRAKYTAKNRKERWSFFWVGLRFTAGRVIVFGDERTILLFLTIITLEISFQNLETGDIVFNGESTHRW